MSSYKCYTCGATVVGDSFGHRYQCATCEQTEILGKQADASRRAASEQAAQLAEDNRRYQDQQLGLAAAAIQVASLNAALDRAARTKDTMNAARLAAEAHHSADDAYQYGLNYISNEWTDSDPHKLAIWFEENGEYNWSCEDPPYLTPHMMSAFDRGIKDTVKNWTRPSVQYIQAFATAAGEQVMDSFYIPWTVPETGQEITCGDFHSDIKINLTLTGYVEYRASDPFNSADLNAIFQQGVANKEKAVNTPENIRHMLEVIEQTQKQEKKDKFNKTMIDLWPAWLILILIIWMVM
jgi:DNA-directed RNA polymerase subunit RPC12/RpoP